MMNILHFRLSGQLPHFLSVYGRESRNLFLNFSGCSEKAVLAEDPVYEQILESGTIKR